MSHDPFSDDDEAIPPALPQIWRSQTPASRDDDESDTEEDDFDAGALFEQMTAESGESPEEEPDFDAGALFEQMTAGSGESPEEEDDFDAGALFEQMTSEPAEAPEEEEDFDAGALFEQMTSVSEEEEELDPVTLFQQMTAAPAEEDEEDFDAGALFEQMTSQPAESAEEEELDPVALFQRMTAEPVEEDEEDFDAGALFEQMTAQPADEDEEDFDAGALFEQMTSPPAEPSEFLEDDELEPIELFQQMAAEPAEEADESFDADALFEQATSSSAEPAEDEALDPVVLFLQMTTEPADKVDVDFDSGAHFEEIVSQPVEPAEDETLDPVVLFLQMTTESADKDEADFDTGAHFEELALQPAEPVEDEALDPVVLFLQMTTEPVEKEESGFNFGAHLEPTELQPVEFEEEADLDPVGLFGLMTVVPAELEEEKDLDPVALFLQMTAEPSEEEELDPTALFQQMTSEPEEELDAIALFEQLTAQTAASEDEIDAVTLFRQMTTEAQAFADELDPIALFEQMTAETAEAPDTFDPVALFEEMVAQERDTSPEFEIVGSQDLPDAAALFDQLEEPEEPTELPNFAWEEEDEPVPEVKSGFFDKIFARFGREKKKPEALPDPAALFEQIQVEDQLEALERGEFRAESAPLPDLPDLDALRAELDAEMQAELEPDLLGDLSGPERFVDTLSDLAFQGPTFSSAPSQEPPKPGPLPVSPYQNRGSEREEPFSPTGQSAPRTISAPPPASGAAPLSRPQPAPPVSKPVYKPALATSSRSIQTASAPVVHAAQKATRSVSRLWKARTSIARPALAILTRQLSAMLRSGIPLHQSLAFCAESDPSAAPVLEQIVTKVESGYSLSNALREFPDSFDSVFVGLVVSGEMSGRINEMLEKLADVLERELELRKRLISVITYPVMLMAVSLLGTLGFIFFVLPQLMPLFADLGAELPWPTKVLLGLREVLLPLIVLASCSALGLFLARKKIKAALAARPVLQRQLATAALSMPIIGTVYEKMVVSRVLYSLSSMLEVGVTMNQALARSEESAGNAQVAYRLARARQDLSDGSTVTEAFRDNEVFPNTALQLILAGEESARTVEMFNYVARSFDDEVEFALQAAAGYLEPLIMVVMGVVVGFITIAAAMPTIELLQNFG